MSSSGRSGMLTCVAALLLAGAAQAPPDRARVDEALKNGVDLIRRNAFAEAIDLLDPLAADPATADPSLAAELHYQIGQSYYMLARYREADDHWRHSADSARTAHDRRLEARTVRAIAQMRKNQGRYAEGLDLGKQAIALYEEIGDSRNAALGWIVIGAINDLAGDHRQALDSFEHAVPVFGQEETSQAANLLYEMGITYKNLGNYSEAARCYERALSIYTRLNEVRNRATVLGNMAVLYGTVGEEERALGYIQQAVAEIRRVDDPRSEAIWMLNLADMYWDVGDRARARETLQQDLAISQRIGARSEEAVGLKNLGDMRTAERDYAGAHEAYDRALQIQRDMGERRTEASTLMAIADLTRLEGHAGNALRIAREALTMAHDTGRLELEWNARRAVAEAAAAAGATAEALDQLRASAAIINDLRAHITADTSKIAYVDGRQTVFQELAALLVKSGRPGDGLEAAEAGRARAFADLLEQRQVLGKPGDRDALVAVRRARAEMLSTSAAQRPSPSAAPPPAAPSSPGTRAARALDTSLADLHANHQELASLLTAHSSTVADIAATTRRLNATLVEYLVTENQLLIWVVDPRGDVHDTSVAATRDELETLTKTVRTGIDSPPQRSKHVAASVDAALRSLDRLTIAPVVKWLPASPEETVIVVPHGPLVLLPFAALLDDAGRPLIDRHVLTFAPAASVFTYTQAKRHTGPDPDRRALVVADPEPPAESGAERLPWAHEEGARIAARLGRARVTLLDGREATESAVKRSAGDYALLHFATHGLVAPERPLASSLLLGAGDGEDGYLRVDEIFGLDLRADLVVLSGCSTGLGRLTGDGVIGLTRAFIYAGTPTVVVSEWNVSDRATAALMDRFYAELSRGRTKAQALRSATLATRRSFPNPASWAAFELVGEPR